MVNFRHLVNRPGGRNVCGVRRNEAMRQRFVYATRKHHHPRDSRDAGVEITQQPAPASDHLLLEIERILETIDEVLEENSELDPRA
jgi:hypothetical protein